MILSTKTGFLDKIYGIKDAIAIIADAGFDAIDFSMDSAEYGSDVHSKEYYTELRKYAESKGVYFNQAHGPDGSSFADEERNKKRFQEVIFTIRHAALLGAENIIIHPCQHMDYYKQGNAERLFEYNMEFYRKLIPYCEEYGIKVAIENMWQYPKMISHSTCSRPDEFIRYIDELSSEWIVGCLDIGHSVLVREDPAEFIRKLGNKRLKCLHVHDVDGNDDLHTLPYFGITDWESVMSALAEIDYKGDFTYEADGFLQDKPKELLPDFVKLMEKTGRYMIKDFNR